MCNNFFLSDLSENFAEMQKQRVKKILTYFIIFGLKQAKVESNIRWTTYIPNISQALFPNIFKKRFSWTKSRPFGRILWVTQWQRLAEMDMAMKLAIKCRIWKKIFQQFSLLYAERSFILCFRFNQPVVAGR